MGEKKMNNTYFIIAVFIGIIFYLLAALWRERKNTENLLDELLQKLDRAIHGEIQELRYDESMEAAITERFNRLIEISGINKYRAENERDTIKSLISDISHQVKTPLSNIMIYTELLKEQNLNENAMIWVDKIYKHSEKLDFFIKELVKSSYSEQEMISVHPDIISIEEIVNMACQTVEIAALKKKIDIRKEMMKGNCYADKKWTIEALGNLLDNAIKYSPEQSTVFIKEIEQESFLCIEVEDCGIGIKEEEQGRVFERFYRSEDVKKEPGFGIGLYLVREVLSKQGGYVKLSSAIGKGTVVKMYLSRYCQNVKI